MDSILGIFLKCSCWVPLTIRQALPDILIVDIEYEKDDCHQHTKCRQGEDEPK